MLSIRAVVRTLPLVVGDVLVLHWDVEVNPARATDALRKQRQNVDIGFSGRVPFGKESTSIVRRHFHCMSLCPVTISKPWICV